MNTAHLHLILNHLPITFVIFGLILIIGGFVLKSELLKRIAYFLFILAAFFGFAGFLTGESAKHLLEGAKGIDPRFVTIHEETALIFLVFLYILGVTSVIGLWANWKEKAINNFIAVIALIILFVALYFAIKTGISGGNIRHIELR